MPGLPLSVREATNDSHSGTADQMCRQDSRVNLCPQEVAAAEESLSIYCKPVELYNILQRRTLQNPSFLQRCLHYKIHAKRKRRVRMTLSVSEENVKAANHIAHICNLGKTIYRLSRACVLTAFSESEKKDQAEANFILPEINKLLSDEIKAGKLTILLVTSLGEKNLSEDQLDMKLFPSNLGGHCLWGNIPMESLYLSWEKSGHPSTIALHSSFWSSVSKHLPVNISAQEFGGKETSPYNSSYNYNYVSSSSSLPHIIRLRTGNVIFNYNYCNNSLQKTEVTEDFSFPFCLLQCASFKGLGHHLSACHDLFNFEFWVTEEYQAVNVSVKIDIWRTEIVADGVDPRSQAFFFSSKFPRRRRSNEKNVHPLFWKSDSPQVNGLGFCKPPVDEAARMPVTYAMNSEPINHSHRVLDKDARSSNWQIVSHDAASNHCGTPFVSEFMERVASSPNMTVFSTAIAQSPGGPESLQPAAGNTLAPPPMLQFARKRKLSVERSDPRNTALLQKRQFFHSHRAQPMSMEQVLSDRDSEDESDDGIADFEDRRMIDEFVDVTKDEKQIMHLWNSFVRKQRVWADGHVPWACEAFSKLHGPDLVRAQH
ncbi:hypothetical protein C5167_007162 [Papaver somniferum]|uniref:Uncharacterized protein n=1 Tax=Papaver somniferum TaxID=3469 RepID=A0A4Y7JFE9_PAPSO|nr:hypothetical protein C5167_007162 [Papaver somniferum]